jgi:hypothetical protein
MSKIDLSLRISGELPPLDDLIRLLGVTPTYIARRGEPIGKRRIQPTDVWILDLTHLDRDSTEDEIASQILQAAATVQQIAPALAALDRTCCRPELYISTIREEDQGGFSLPGEIVTAAAAANLSSIEVSILVMLDDYEEPEI